MKKYYYPHNVHTIIFLNGLADNIDYIIQNYNFVKRNKAMFTQYQLSVIEDCVDIVQDLERLYRLFGGEPLPKKEMLTK